MKNQTTNILIMTLSTLISLTVCEGILSLLHLPSAPIYKEGTSAQLNKFCSVDSMQEAIQLGLVKGILGDYKPDQDLGYTAYSPPHGFVDKKNFYDDYSHFKRILMLGDSFVWGYSADPGKGFVDLLSDYYRDQGIIFFNTGVGGYGQIHELAVLHKYFDIIKPHMVLLGFYTGNDFRDNLMPLDHYTLFYMYAVENYEINKSGKGIALRRREPDEVLRIYQNEIGCSQTVKYQKFFYKFRIGKYAWKTFSKLRHLSLNSRNKIPSNEIDSSIFEYNQTRDFLKKIKEFLHEKNTPFYVLIIPDIQESKSYLKRSRNYKRAIKLLDELQISYLDIFGDLTLSDYGPKIDRWHWNNSGHFKMFQKIKDCFGESAERGELHFCLEQNA